MNIVGIRPEQGDPVPNQNNVLILVRLSTGNGSDMLSQVQISSVALHLVASKDWRQGPEQSASSAVWITIPDLVRGQVQLEITMVDDFLSGRISQSEPVLIVVDPHGDRLNVQGALVTLVSQPAAVTLAASVRILPGQSKRPWTTPVALRPLDVSFTVASVADAVPAA